MEDQKQVINFAEIEDAIRRSGYLLERRVGAVFSDNGFHVDSNPAYPDPNTGKSREFDLSAYAAFDLLGRRSSIDFFGVLVSCECEDNHQPVAFFASKPDQANLYKDGVKCSGFPLSFRASAGTASLVEILAFESFHHYWKWPIASQYCSFGRKNTNSPWLALHTEGHHETLTALTNVIRTRIDEHYRLLVDWGPEIFDVTNIRLHLPLMVLGGDLILVSEQGRKLRIRGSNYVQYRREVWRGETSEIFHIDIITEKFLTKYIAILHKEIDEIRARAESDAKKVLNSLSAISMHGKRKLTKDALRTICESPFRPARLKPPKIKDQK